MILYRSDKETAVKTALGRDHALLHNEEPRLFPNISIGEKIVRLGQRPTQNTLRLAKKCLRTQNIDQPKRTHTPMAATTTTNQKPSPITHGSACDENNTELQHTDN
jgi:hypothetical protein